MGDFAGMADFEGGCVCEAIRYKVTAAPLAAMACHCRACQYASGGAEANLLTVSRKALAVKGEPTIWRSRSDTGSKVWRAFCPKCGTPLFSGYDAHLDVVALKVGSLDDPSRFKRGSHIWMASAPAWHLVEPGVPKSRGNPAT